VWPVHFAKRLFALSQHIRRQKHDPITTMRRRRLAPFATAIAEPALLPAKRGEALNRDEGEACSDDAKDQKMLE